MWKPEKMYGPWDTFRTANVVLPLTSVAGLKTRLSVGGGGDGCNEYKMKDVLITRPMPTNTHTRNHRWEMLGGSDNVLYATPLRLRFRGLSDASRAPSLGAGRYLEFAT